MLQQPRMNQTFLISDHNRFKVRNTMNEVQGGQKEKLWRTFRAPLKATMQPTQWFAILSRALNKIFPPILLVLLFILATFTKPSYCTEEDPSPGNYRRFKHDHKPRLALNEAPHEPEYALKDLADSLHESQHDHTPHKGFKQKLRHWVEHFYVIDHLKDLFRWYQYKSYQYPEWKEHISNLTLLYGSSHLVEVLFGPVAAGITHQMGGPEWLEWGFVGLGGVISLPGLDPLCIVLFGTYRANEKFRLHISKARLISVKTLKSLFPHSRFNRPHLSRLPQLELDFPSLSLHFSAKEGVEWLDSIVWKDKSLFQKDLLRLNNLLDRNTYEAIVKTNQLNSGERIPFYVHSFSDQKVVFHQGAIRPWRTIKDCNEALKTK